MWAFRHVGMWASKWFDGQGWGFKFEKSHQVFCAATVTVKLSHSHSAFDTLLNEAFAQLDAGYFDLCVKFPSIYRPLDQLKCWQKVFL